jgi:hypothetical protein
VSRGEIDIVGGDTAGAAEGHDKAGVFDTFVARFELQ